VLHPTTIRHSDHRSAVHSVSYFTRGQGEISGFAKAASVRTAASLPCFRWRSISGNRTSSHPLSAVHVARLRLGCRTVSVPIEQQQRRRIKVAVVDAVLLLAVAGISVVSLSCATRRGSLGRVHLRYPGLVRVLPDEKPVVIKCHSLGARS
jgi:hypothetical protein